MRVARRSPGQAVDCRGRQIDLFGHGMNPLCKREQVPMRDNDASPLRRCPAAPCPRGGPDWPHQH